MENDQTFDAALHWLASRDWALLFWGFVVLIAVQIIFPFGNKGNERLVIALIAGLVYWAFKEP